MKRGNVLFLGATGRMGPSIIEEYLKNYRDYYDVILGYHHTKPRGGIKIRKADLSSISSLKKAMKNVDVVVNLAAKSNPEAEFEELIKPNLIGAYNVFEAARKSKVKRVIFASSVHSVKGYPLGSKILHDDFPRPPNLYGATKVFGEALCHVFSHKYGLSCLAIRIGAYVSDDKKKTICFTRENYDYVITQRDFMQLVHKCIQAPKKIKFGILSGSSDNKRKYMDLDFTKNLVGYKPRDDAYKICEEIKRRHKKHE